MKKQIPRLDLSTANKQTNGRHVHTSRLLRLQFKRHNKKMLCYGQARGQRPVRNANDQLKRSILILYISKWYKHDRYTIIGTGRKLYNTYFPHKMVFTNTFLRVRIILQILSSNIHITFFCTWIDTLHIYVTINVLQSYVTSKSRMSLEYL